MLRVFPRNFCGLITCHVFFSTVLVDVALVLPPGDPGSPIAVFDVS